MTVYALSDILVAAVDLRNVTRGAVIHSLLGTAVGVGPGSRRGYVEDVWPKVHTGAVTNLEGDGSDRVHVVYSMQQDQGWPPVAEERVWAIALSDSLVRIDNIPWFIRNLALGDLVQVAADASGVLRPLEKVRWAGYCTIRLIPYRENRDAVTLQGALDMFQPLGVMGECIDQFGIVAIAVPPSADLAAIKGLLVRGSETGWWDYEEACVGGAW